MYKYIELNARCIGKTKTLAKIAKKMGAKVCCADEMSAKRLRLEYGVDTIIVDKAEHFRGCYKPIVYDADTIVHIVFNMNKEIGRLKNEIERLQDKIWKLKEEKIMLSIPQGKDLVGYLCGVSDKSLEEAQENAEQCTGGVSIISRYNKYDEDTPYEDTAGFAWAYAWPVFKQDIEPNLLDGKEIRT